jgi:hypothetical protein
MSNLNEDQFGGYGMQHRPDASGPPMHAVEDSYPGIYERPQLYNNGGGDDDYRRASDESLRHIQRVKGKPDAPVTMYRSVPKGVTKINPGDWVSTSRSKAKREGLHPTDPKQDMPVISQKVRAKDLRTPGDDVSEWGFFPQH